MKLNILTTAALLAIAGAVMTQSAKAQFTSSSGAAPGDLILGFSNGGNTDFEIDLGQFTLYSGNSQILIANIASDLSADYGSNWFSNPNLQLAFGGASTTTSQIYVSDPSSTAFSPVANTSLQNLIGDLATLGKPVADTNNPPTAGLLSGSLNVPKANAGSLDTVTAAQSSLSLGTIGTTFGAGAPNLYLDVITAKGQLSTKATGTSAIFGPDAFSVQSNGNVYYDYTPAAVPEPSAYALCVAGLVLLIALKRRQSAASL